MKFSDIGVMFGTGLIRGYQLVLGPWLGGRCRFYPSCSAFALEAVQTHGLLKGTYYALRRMLRCHPLHPGGVDLVPPLKMSGDSLSCHCKRPTRVAVQEVCSG